ncbi:MAG: porphobilinogen synthase [Candidatus Omnitrophota bacterium]
MRAIRLRELRKNKAIRDRVSQTNLSAKDLILPYFVVRGENIRKEIKSMPGVYHLSIDNLIKDISESAGLKSVLLFGIAGKKDKTGSESYRKDGIVQKAIRRVKKEFPDLVVITDVCLCSYTTHGHCGVVRSQKTEDRRQTVVDNDETLKILAKIALSHAEAGADYVAPSAMMDGQVGAIREALDENGFEDTRILAYSAKYASAFYGPFRDALDSAPRFGDRKTYQMDHRNSDEALREIKQDIDEGANIVMVKPALVYLDIVYRAKQAFDIPIAAYNVSGEHSMVKNISGGDKEAEKALALEILTSIKRAGADLIISYFTKEALKWLK